MKPLEIVKSVAIVCLIGMLFVTQRQLSISQQQTREAITVAQKFEDAFKQMEEANNQNHNSAVTCTESLKQLTAAVMGTKQ